MSTTKTKTKPPAAANPAANLFTSARARALLAPKIAEQSQSAIARRSGIARQNLATFMRGQDNLSLESRLRLAMACGYRVSLWVERAPPSTPDPAP